MSDDAWLEMLKKPDEAALELTETEVKQALRLLGVDDAREES
jgi:hypothetical protein